MHRINKIKQISKWHYIPSEQNPTDLCTRTQTDFKLIQQKLCQKTIDLKEITVRNQFEESLEINTSLITHSSKKENCNSCQIIKWDSYSS